MKYDVTFMTDTVERTYNISAANINEAHEWFNIFKSGVKSDSVITLVEIRPENNN